MARRRSRPAVGNGESSQWPTSARPMLMRGDENRLERATYLLYFANMTAAGVRLSTCSFLRMEPIAFFTVGSLR